MRKFLWGLALKRGLRIPSSFWVALRVDLTRWVGLTCNFSLPLPVAVINGLYKLTEVQQGDGPVMVHHLVFDATGYAFVGLLEEGMVTPLYVGRQAVKLHKVCCGAGSFSHD